LLTAQADNATVGVMTKPQVFVIFSVLFLLSVVPVSAQTLDDLYNNFVAAYNSYRTAETHYLDTRSQYLQYGTLASRNDALIAVKDFLSVRNDVLLSHLAMVKLVNNNDVFGAQLSDHVSFLSDTKNKIPALASLDDAVSFSGQIEKRHIGLQDLSRQIVGAFNIDKLDSEKLRFLLLENEASTLISSLRAQNKDVATLDRWLQDAKNKRQLAEGKIDTARSMVNNFSAGSVSEVTQKYNDLLQILAGGQEYLKEAISNMHELSDAMKYGNY
jgi:hypothetical protein